MHINLSGGQRIFPSPHPLSLWERGAEGRVRGWEGSPAWEGGQEERDALHSSVICSNDTICVTRPERGYALFPL